MYTPANTVIDTDIHVALQIPYCISIFAIFVFQCTLIAATGTVHTSGVRRCFGVGELRFHLVIE
jgi:hypothetical protein